MTEKLRDILEEEGFVGITWTYNTLPGSEFETVAPLIDSTRYWEGQLRKGVVDELMIVPESMVPIENEILSGECLWYVIYTRKNSQTTEMECKKLKELFKKEGFISIDNIPTFGPECKTNTPITEYTRYLEGQLKKGVIDELMIVPESMVPKEIPLDKRNPERFHWYVAYARVTRPLWRDHHKDNKKPK